MMSPPLDTLLVVPRPGAPNRGLLLAGPAAMPCLLGRGGVVRRKREGDGATPVGAWPLRALYYRPDRVRRPETALSVHPIHPGLGWSDDPADPLYNRPVRLPRRAGHERMWRDDHLYDYVVVLGHNDSPPLRPRGSAVFLHLASGTGAPTAGCVAVSLADMRRLLPRLGPATRLVVRG